MNYFYHYHYHRDKTGKKEKKRKQTRLISSFTPVNWWPEINVVSMIITWFMWWKEISCLIFLVAAGKIGNSAEVFAHEYYKEVMYCYRRQFGMSQYY